ncbi:DNA helicase/exodeoxyribonuclease V subunit A [Mobilisporobacter senegalensis]|uniref:ATP-dependent helicase/nuclease subunit A n=1 Tax=Mobilisporobacter senegalensis TaxID=1329262 RepID=A0A3N1X9L1_9FIRM|nr:helicase-exonuclease AddAB subunit AddA [Mobilisporobacter senegalensis]ROR23449.1 DNA helicase/exodeoxyribonuclease V subunit A [Mobilisporobacter senegalensis]
MKWTSDQQKVIELRNRNILVSAAAGSGKTAVLVERIITMITEGDNPIDIDKLLIVTFTNAAAAEMRERIGAAIEKKLSEMPENLHLQKQMTLIHSAQITTIHSFCLNIIRNYFHTIDLDPSFRVADETELKLLKSDVMEELLERYYEEAKEDFLIFTESYASGKSDALMEELILSLYGFSMSYPWPEDWLNEIRGVFNITSVEEMEKSEWMDALLHYIKAMIHDTILNNRRAIQIGNEPGGPYPYVDALESDKELLEKLAGAATYQEYGELLRNISWARLSNKKDASILEAKKSEVKEIRDSIKKIINDITKNFFFQSKEEMLKDIMGTKITMNVLIDLTLEFAKDYANRKRDKNLVDFNDLEHFALNILVSRNASDDDQEQKDIIPTSVAIDLSEHYEEILIDEYQDSNLVQETLLNSISRERAGNPNIFMVGDVKQSIYKFRLARPELFMEKYESYSLEDGLKQRIDLHKNFRSRRVVLDSINFIFEQIMGKDLGGIVYDQDAALYVGADYDENAEGISNTSELLLVNMDDNLEGTDEFEEDDSIEEMTQKELEARAIGKRIKELIHPETGLMILDKENSREKPVYKRATGKDIVILLRTMSGWSDIFVDVLMSEGISAYSDTQSGYFKTLEIQTVLNMLKIIDNPKQDIPLAAVLHSAIVGLTSEELAKIHASFKDMDIYDAVTEYSKYHIIQDPKKIDENADDNNLSNEINNESLIDGLLAEKLKNFLADLEKFRRMVAYTPIHEMIEQVLEETGYYNYIAAMPGGERRTGNIDILIQRAINFEATSYSGLFHFIRYIEKLHKYEIDYGEASVSGGDDLSVKIMSIHKSKGLEFPIVFVAGLSKNFNNQDTRSKIVIHPDLGLGPDYIDFSLRIKSPTLIKKVMQKKLVLENLAEELRVLYVALTRAKEKLILTGTVKNLKDKLGKWSDIRDREEVLLTFQKITSATTYLDWIGSSLIRHKSFDSTLIEYELPRAEHNPLYEKEIPWEVRILNVNELSMVEVAKQIEKEILKDELLQWDAEMIFNQEIRDEIEDRLSFKYPYLNSIKIPAKMTVSELKKLGQMEAEEMEQLEQISQEVFHQADRDINHQNENNSIYGKDDIIPKFIRKEKPMKASDRGTLYHKILECIDLGRVKTREDIKNELERMVKRNIIKEENISQISQIRLEHFLNSNVAMRMREALMKDKVKKEQQFVLGIPANEVNKEISSNELILIQGIIDVYFEEEDGIVLLDYKTDYIPEGENEGFLINKYKVQLDYYQKAIEQLVKKPVKEKIIYSFGLEKEIHLD